MHASSQLQCSPWSAVGPLTQKAVAPVLTAMLLLLCSFGSASAQIPVFYPGSRCYYHDSYMLECMFINASPETNMGCGVPAASASIIYGTCRQTIISSDQKLCTYKAGMPSDMCYALMASYAVPVCSQDVVNYEGVNGVITDCASFQQPVNQITSSPSSTNDTYSGGSPPVNSPTPSAEPGSPPVEESPSPAPDTESPSSPPALTNTNAPSSPTPNTIPSPQLPQSLMDPSKQCGEQPPIFYVFVVLAFVLITLSTVLAVMAAWPRQLQRGGRAGGSVLDASASIAGIAVGVIGLVTQNYECWADMLVMFAVVYLAAAANGSVWLWLLGPKAQSDTRDAKQACRMMVRFLFGVGSTVGVVLAAVGLLQQTDPETACSLHVVWVQGVCDSHLGVAGQGAPVGKPTWMVTSKHMFIIVLLIVTGQSVIGIIGMIWECCTSQNSVSQKQGLLRMATACLGWTMLCIAAGAVLFSVQLKFLTRPSSHYTIVLTTIIALCLVFLVLVLCIFMNLGAQARGDWSLPHTTVPGQQDYAGAPGHGFMRKARPG